MLEYIFIGGLIAIMLLTCYWFWCHYSYFGGLLRVPCGKYQVMRNDPDSPWVIISRLKEITKNVILKEIAFFITYGIFHIATRLFRNDYRLLNHDAT